MPCGIDDGSRMSECIQEANAATRAACDLAHQIRKHYPQAWISLAGRSVDGKKYKNIPSLSSKTIAWVEEHDKWDRRRRKQEKEEKERKELRRRGIEKLSPKERAALGLSGKML